MRNSDVNAALFWFARMLERGDTLWVARKITRAAAEDVDLADPNALNVAVNAFHATKCRRVSYTWQKPQYISALLPKGQTLYKGEKKERN